MVNVGSPSSSTDAANKQYVDNLINGLVWKNAVAVTTTSPHTLATDFAAGSVVDGYTLALGDRILIKNQTNPAENGIYTANATGAPNIAADGATGELLTNATVRVNNGTVNADTAWTLTTIGTIMVGTTNQTWVRSDSGTPYSAGNGLSLSSNTFAVVPGTGIVADGTSTRIDPTIVVQKKSFNIGDGTSTSIVVNHGLGSRTVTVGLYNSSTYEVVETDVVITDVNNITLTFASAPGTNAYVCVIHG